MKEFLKSEKLLKAAFIVGIIAIALIFLSGLGDSSGKSSTVTKEQQLEQRIGAVLCSMQGMEGAEPPAVMIKLDSDELTVLGVTIICKKAENPVLKEKMLNAVSKALDVSLSEICITT